MVDQLIREVAFNLNNRMYHAGMIALFTLPDSAAAIEYGGGSNGPRYRDWFNEFVDCRQAGLDGALAWQLRNALMHETRMDWRAKGFDFDRVVVSLPLDGPKFHGNVARLKAGEPAAKQLDLATMAQSILNGASSWVIAVRTDPVKAERLSGLMQVRMDGIAPWVIGMPVVG